MRESEYIEKSQKIIELLKKIDKFQGFSDENLFTFIERAKLKDFEKGETIIREGDFDSWIYILLKGTLEVRKNGKLIGSFKRNGDLFGELGIIDGLPRSATITATDRSLVLGIDGMLLDKKFMENDLIFSCLVYRVFSKVLAARLRDTTEENVTLKRENGVLKTKISNSIKNKNAILNDSISTEEARLPTCQR